MWYNHNWRQMGMLPEKGENMKDTLMKLLLAILPTVLNLVTPEIREMFNDFMLRWWEKAKATENKFDDLLVKFIAELTKVDLPD